MAAQEGAFAVGPPRRVGAVGAWQQASLSENGQVFAPFHGDHIQMFEGETLRELAHTDSCGDAGQYRYLTLSADGIWLATGAWQDAAIRIWDVHTGA